MITTGAEHRSRVRHRWIAAPLALVLAATACGGGDGGADAHPLTGSQWEATFVHDGVSLEGTDPTTIVTIAFGTETAEGSDGCNRYVVPYRVDGDRITFGDISSTGAACASDEHATQATTFLGAVGKVTTFERSGDELEMSSDATTLLRWRRADALALTGISWRMTGYRSPGGGMSSPLDGAPLSLWFGDDGSIVGSTGCNSYSAALAVTGTQLSISGLASTEMACDEPTGVMIQEAEYLALLPTASGFRTDLTTLELLDAGGDVIATFAFAGRTR